MQESVSELFSEVRSALRFRWYGMVATWIVCLLGWAYVVSLPDVYEGSARIYVDTTSVLERILGDQINAPEVENQLTYIREALLGREQLEAVANEIGFAPDANVQAREAAIGQLRTEITITSSGGNAYDRPDNIYGISYQHSNRDTAGKVVKTLLESFVADALGQNRRSGETAERFLDDRVGAYEERLARAEAALAAFKRENADRLPGAEGDYYDRMRAERNALTEANRDLRLLESRRRELQAQLSSQAALVAASDPAADLPANSLDARIRDAETQLDLKMLQYTDRHPDVVALRETLQYLKAQRAERLAALGVSGEDLELYSLDANPVYQATQIELNETGAGIAELQADIEDRAERVADLQGLIDELPQVEAQLVQLNRDYDVIYEQYLELVRSRETQQLTTVAADTAETDFRIIDPPFASLNPVGPNRIKLFTSVLFGAIFVGCAICYFCAQLWPVFGRARALRSVTNLPVLGTVSHAWHEKYAAEFRTAMTSYVTALGVLIVLFAGLIGLELVGPGLHAIVSDLS